MACAEPGHVVVHLPAGSSDWLPLLAQLSLLVSAAEGRAYAGWVHERLAAATGREDGVVALGNDGRLLGMLLWEAAKGTVDFTLPWVRGSDPELEYELVQAAMALAREAHPGLRHLRAERQVLPEAFHLAGLQMAGFECHWRTRMQLELLGWRAAAPAPPGYRLLPWHIRFLDAAAEVVFHANDGTLDAKLYAPFFGGSPEECRAGLLTILAGRYGPIHPQATRCAFLGDRMVGVNLVIRLGEALASVIEISVEPAHQGHGLGRALMVASLEELRRDRFDSVELAVTQGNAPAIHLYETLGFRDIGAFPVCVWPG